MTSVPKPSAAARPVRYAPGLLQFLSSFWHAKLAPARVGLMIVLGVLLSHCGYDVVFGRLATNDAGAIPTGGAPAVDAGAVGPSTDAGNHDALGLIDPMRPYGA